MKDSSKIAEILQYSPSVELLRLRNREAIILFLINSFSNQQGTISSEHIHTQLADYLEFRQIENDEDDGVTVNDSYVIKAKKFIQAWANKGFLTNYQDEHGEVFYELSLHASKTIDWLGSLKKEEYVGTESKFKNIFSQLKELVEFTNDDAEKRLQLLELKKKEIEEQIQQIKTGADVKVFEDYEIVPRFKQLNQAARELLSDFKEVEDNFREITKSIYQKHAEGTLKKSDILEFTFEALDEIKESQQGKSFYAFWSFLLNPELQQEWAALTKELHHTLDEKGIVVNDLFLKGMKKYLHLSGQKVYKANDKMAEKLSRIIRETETSKAEATMRVIQEIKKTLLEISKTKKKPTASFELETDSTIDLPFERKLTLEEREELSYTDTPSLADEDIALANHLGKLFARSNIDKNILRQRIKEVLKDKSQTTIHEVIALNGGIEKGLPELFAYLSIVKEFNHSTSTEKTQRIIFNKDAKKSILVPEVIIVR